MHWWMSTRRMTVCVKVNAIGVVVDVPPILGKFKGCRVGVLKRWLRKQGGYKEKKFRAV